MNANAADGYAGLLQWSDPIIFDRMLEAYGASVSDLKVVWRLARLHARVWGAMIEGDFAGFGLGGGRNLPGLLNHAHSPVVDPMFERPHWPDTFKIRRSRQAEAFALPNTREAG